MATPDTGTRGLSTVEAEAPSGAAGAAGADGV